MIDLDKRYIIRLPNTYQARTFNNARVLEWADNMLRFTVEGKEFIMPAAIVVLEEQDNIEYLLTGEETDE